ncbi:MAG: permease prefix domain 1-containing protein [Oscillospiraceae bacterium]|nr:permease prefix domain 1-containing protein [Oscillospiraceae bacterium]
MSETKDMKEKIYVDRLFAGCEDTPEIRDFKEEISANLAEHIQNLIKKGLGEEQAFEKAAAELGDITAIADEIGNKKRNETIGQLYMKSKVPITKKTAAGLTAASGLLMIAAGIFLFTFFGGAAAGFYYISAVLLAGACGLYIFFGLTQETASHYAVKKNRALAYGAVGFFGLMGAGTAASAVFFNGLRFYTAAGIASAFIIPAVCALIFLLTTEPKRQKPWLRAMVRLEIENSLKYHQDMVNPVKAARFGVMSGGVWILAVTVFLTFGFIFGWQYAWLVFPFALAVQVFMTAMIFEKN